MYACLVRGIVHLGFALVHLLDEIAEGHLGTALAVTVLGE